MGYYKLHTQGPLHSSKNGTKQLISSLTFIPKISIHKGAVFKCQVSYIGKDKIVEERVSEKFTVLCKNMFFSIIQFIFVSPAAESLVCFVAQLLLRCQKYSWQKHKETRVIQEDYPFVLHI